MPRPPCPDLLRYGGATVARRQVGGRERSTIKDQRSNARWKDKTSRSPPLDYQSRDQFDPFHDRTGALRLYAPTAAPVKTVACIQELPARRAAMPARGRRFRLMFILRQSAVAWDYLRGDAVLRRFGATTHESELRVDYPQGRRSGPTAPTIPTPCVASGTDGIVLDEYADMDPRMWSRSGRRWPTGWAGRCSSAPWKGRNAFFELQAALAEGGGLVLHDAQESRPGSSPPARLSWRGAISPRSNTPVNSNALSRRRRHRRLRKADDAGRGRASCRRRRMIPPCWCGRRGTSASATPPRSGSRSGDQDHRLLREGPASRSRPLCSRDQCTPLGVHAGHTSCRTSSRPELGTGKSRLR